MSSRLDPVKLREAGCNVEQMKTLGLSAGEIASAGFGLRNLYVAGFELKDVLEAGFRDCKALVQVGVEAWELHFEGKFSLEELKAAGCTVEQKLKGIGYTGEELANAGFQLRELRAGGFEDAVIAAAGVRILSGHVCGPKDGRVMCKNNCNPEISGWKCTHEWEYDEEYDGGSIGEYGYAHGCKNCGFCPICHPNGCPQG